MASHKLDIPIVVDLDGTIVRSDTLLESLVALIISSKIHLFYLPYWALYGKVFLKKKIAERAILNYELLPYEKELIDFLRLEKSNGRKIILATGAYKSIANMVSKHLNLFDAVYATDSENLTGTKKADVLVKRFGYQGFDYAGNSSADLHIWRVCRTAIAVNTSPGVLKKLLNIKPQTLDTTFVKDNFSFKKRIGIILKAIRVKQWVKNSLIFVPLILSQAYVDSENIFYSMVAFIAFSSCASSVYLLNDLVDIDSDRQHRYKKFRPFASGSMNLLNGLFLAVALLFIGFFIGSKLNPTFLLILTLYYLLTLLYSFVLKRLVLIDIFCLAILFTSRILAGGAAIEIELSNWLLMFSFFIFLSLAILKRYIDADLDDLNNKNREDLISAGRGYVFADLIPLLALGISCGLISVLIFLFYITDPIVIAQYKSSEFLWIVAIALTYWISNLWILASRNLIFEDPISFALKEKNSIITILAIIILFLLAILL